MFCGIFGTLLLHVLRRHQADTHLVYRILTGKESEWTPRHGSNWPLVAQEKPVTH